MHVNNEYHPPLFARKWLQNRTNGYKMGENQPRETGAPMNEELRQATDIAKDPAAFSMFTYFLMLALSMWGGVVRVIREVVLKEKSAWHIFGIFLAEMCVSGFVGTITFSLCVSSNMSFAYTGALTAIAGYMGGRSLSMFETLYKSWKDKL